MKKIITITLSFVTIFSLTNFNTVVLQACDSVEECKAEQERLQDAKDQKQQEINALKDEHDDIGNKIVNTSNQVDYTREQIEAVQKEIDLLLTQIQELEVQIQKKQDRVLERLKIQQKQQNNNQMLAILMSTTSITDFVQRMEALTKYQQAEQKEMQELDDDKKELETLQAENEASKQNLEDKKAELETLKAQLSADLQRIQELEAHAEGDMADLQLSEAEINNQLAILQNGVPSAYGWYLPAAQGWLTCEQYCYAGHIGTDFGMNRNTGVHAMAAGRVIYTYDGVPPETFIPGSFGNMIVISHVMNGVPHITIYAHLNSVQVSVGQVVSGGQHIGLSGNTGASTGPHLHIEMVANVSTFVDKPTRAQNIVNPLNVLPRPANGWVW